MVSPIHIVDMLPASATGVWFTVVDNEAVVAQTPGVGIKLWVPLAVLLIVEGVHTPVIAGVFVEPAGNAGATVPLQNAGIAANVGVTFGFTVVVKVAVTAHWPVAGVKV